MIPLRTTTRSWREFFRRKGAVAVLAALLMVLFFAFVAFTVDVGYLAMTKAKLQMVADSAALAAAQELNPLGDQAQVRTAAQAAATLTAGKNLGSESSYFNAQTDLQFGKQTYNATTKTYSYTWGDSAVPHNVVRVTAQRHQRVFQQGGSTTTSDERIPLFFAPVLGVNKADLEAKGVAGFAPRDIVVVLDFSASMRYDSMYMRIGTLGQTAIENNLKQIYQELGSPVYGNKLTLMPNYVTFSGQPKSGTIPHIDVVFKGTNIDVTSTSTITSVKLTFSDGATQTISGTAKTGNFKGSSSNNGKVVTAAAIKSGSNGTNGESFSFSTSSIKTALGLASIAYPYPSGSWSEFIDYCNSSSEQVADAGYRWKYGYINWVNYQMDYYPGYDETPDFWKTSQQPVASLKYGVNLFMDYLTSIAAEDRVGLSNYSTPTGAILEHGLSSNLAQIKTTTSHRQAGHYDQYTNIGMGMQLARQELVTNGRPNAARLMVVMTDGVANRPTNTSTAKALVQSEAALAASNKIKILTISLGVLADTALMQEVADTTGGIHFNVPGGSNISDYQTQLEDAFIQIGSTRPLKLLADPGP